MKTYLVGGAVRDAMLNRPVHERDWLVVSASAQMLLDAGFEQVGKDFPVFLHPETKEEYALARTERKSGQGYTGFVFDTSSDVTLEQDLKRRDLTVNAMAMTEDGQLVDPYGGQQDLNNKVLRHVSDAFAEDPLRVFRVARFAARYAHLGFTIADETLELMTQMAASGELNSLSPERVWKETARSLLEQSPWVYFEVLRSCDALSGWFMELNRLWGVPQAKEHHPEVDTGIHTMLVLQQSAKLSEQLSVRFAALLHDLGKGMTPQALWPKHSGHEEAGVSEVAALCDRLKCPNDCKTLAMLVCANHGLVHKALKLSAEDILHLFDATDVWRKPDRFEDLLLACIADARGRPGYESTPYPQAELLRRCHQTCTQIDIQSIVRAGFKGGAIKQELQKQRLQCINEAKAAFNDKN